MTSTIHTIGVPTASYIAAAQQNKTTLEMLMNLQNLVDEFKVKAAEMDEEMRTIKIENTLLKNKIKELTSNTTGTVVDGGRGGSTGPSSRRGFFGYGADEF